MRGLWKLRMAGKQKVLEGTAVSPCDSDLEDCKGMCAVLSCLSHSPRTVAQNLGVQQRHPGLPGRGREVLYFTVGCTMPLFLQIQLPYSCSSFISRLAFLQGSHTAFSTWGHWGGNPKVENSPALFLVGFLAISCLGAAG